MHQEVRPMKSGSKAAQNSGNTVIDTFKNSYSKGFVRDRFFAVIIDLLVVILLCWLAFSLFGAPDWGRYMQMQDEVRGLASNDPLVLERIAVYQNCFITSLAIGAAYEALALVVFGTTIGKLICGFRVVSAKDGRNTVLTKVLFALRAVIKSLSIYLLSGIPFIFMCLTAFGNAEGRSGFDMFAGSKVVKVRGIRR